MRRRPTPAILLMLCGLSGCGFMSAFNSFQSFEDPFGPIPDTEIEYTIKAASLGDLVTIYGDNTEVLARDLMPVLGMQSPEILNSDSIDYYAEIRDSARERSISRDGSDWVFRLDTGPIQQRLKAQGIDTFRLTICHPAVEVGVLSPGGRATEVICDEPFGVAWDIRSDEPPSHVSLRLIPREAHWRAFVIALAIWFGLYGIVAVAAGRVIRRDTSRGGGALAAMSITIGFFAALFTGLAFFGIGAMAGPADNLALARDTGAVGWAGAGLVPASGAFVPWIGFSLAILWGRPWRRSRGARAQGNASEWVHPPAPPPPPPLTD